MMPWDSFLTEQDRAVIAHGRFGRRMGFGEAAFDRIPISHAVSLFDMDRQFADVVGIEQALAYLQALPASPASGLNEGTS